MDNLRNLSVEQLVKIADVLKTIAHPVRLDIIKLLEKHDKLCVNDIVEHTKIEQSLLSHHLTKMKDRGILSSKRDGKHIFYSISMTNIPNIFDCMERCKI
ncbi:MAG: winged helix-turn-helix transcriptional regulator [Desulfobulbaceae bacterium]|nr:winged helix-turn-helix transcriptional regulator [Desulfobulbaceae bacterium]